MKELDTGREKVKKICDVLRKDTLEPAKREADEIVKQAKLQADLILKEAKEKAEKNLSDAQKEIERKHTVFTASLHQAGKQTLEALKNEIENKLFSPALAQLLNRPLSDDKVVFDLISAVVEALKKEGVDADLNIFVPRAVSAADINDRLLRIAGENLRSSVSSGDIEGGVSVRLVKENITIDITDEALKDWMSKYVRQDFRKILFGVQ